MTAREVIAEAQLFIGDPDEDFHTDARALIALNRSLQRISTRSRSIHEQIYHSVAAGQYQYGLPLGTVFIRKVKYFNGTWRDLTRETFDSVEAVAAYPSGGPPYLFSLWQSERIEKFVGPVTAIAHDASLLPTLQNSVTFASPYSAESNLTDSSIKIGDVVFNLSTKHAEGVITQRFAVQGAAGSIRVAYSPLVGGTAPIFSVDNEIRVTSPHTSGHSLIIAPAPLTADKSGEESLAAFVARRHRIIDATHITNENDTLELDDGFADSLMYEVLHWLRTMEEGLDVTAQNYRTLANTEYNRAMPLVMNRIHQNLSLWGNALSRGGSNEYREIGGRTPTTGQGYNNVNVR